MARTLRDGAGIAAKADIGLVAARLGLAGGAVPVGDDCAAIPDGDGHLLFAIEGFMNEFVAADPWFAGWCGVMVNLSDIAAMGGRPLAVVDAIWADGEADAAPVLDGLRAAARAYGVPIVGGHTNLRTAQGQLAVAVLGRAGHALADEFRRPARRCARARRRSSRRLSRAVQQFQAALDAPPERLRADLAVLAEIAERGLARAAKDISQGGVPGTAIMLAESSGVAIDLDLDAIVPPPGVTLERWLKTFPSFGFLLSVAPANRRAGARPCSVRATCTPPRSARCARAPRSRWSAVAVARCCATTRRERLMGLSLRDARRMSRARVAMLAHSTNPRGGVVHAMSLSEALTTLGAEAVLHAPDAGGRGFFRAARLRSARLSASRPRRADLPQMVEHRIADYRRLVSPRGTSRLRRLSRPRRHFRQRAGDA